MWAAPCGRAEGGDDGRREDPDLDGVPVQADPQVFRRFSAGVPQVFRRFSAGVPEALFSWLVLTSGTILAPPKTGGPRWALYNNINSGGVGYLNGPSVL